MGSVIVSWTGSCADSGTRTEFLRWLEPLATLASPTEDDLRLDDTGSAGIRRYDGPLVGRVAVTGAALAGYRGRAEVLASHSGRVASAGPTIATISKVILHGLSFPVAVPNQHFSFVFASFPEDETPFPRIVAVRSRDEIGALCDELEDADWLLDNPSLYLRHSFETSINLVLGAIKHLFIDDLDWWSHRWRPGYLDLTALMTHERHSSREDLLDRTRHALVESLRVDGAAHADREVAARTFRLHLRRPPAVGADEVTRILDYARSLDHSGDNTAAQLEYQYAIDLCADAGGHSRIWRRAQFGRAAALLRSDRIQDAAEIYSTLAQPFDDDVAPHAAVMLGRLWSCAETGDAELTFAQWLDLAAALSSHIREAPALYSLDLGRTTVEDVFVLAKNQRNRGLAWPLFRAVAASGDPELAPLATLWLDLMREPGSAWPKFDAILQIARSSDTVAADAVGCLLESIGAHAGAVHAFRSTTRPRKPVALRLGTLLRVHPEDEAWPGEAAYWLTDALAAATTVVRERAALELARLVRDNGDTATAAALFERCIAESTFTTRTAANELERMFEVAGDPRSVDFAFGGGRADSAVVTPPADCAFQFAIDTGHAKWAPVAAVLLGRTKESRGDLAGAGAAYKTVVDLGFTDTATGVAAIRHAMLAFRRRENAMGRRGLQHAKLCNDAQVSAAAEVALGHLDDSTWRPEGSSYPPR